MIRLLSLLAAGLLAGLAPGLVLGFATERGVSSPSLEKPAGALRDVALSKPEPMPESVGEAAADNILARPKIAVVIDDLGLDSAAFEATNALPGRLTLAFLPYGQEAQAMLDRVASRHEAILHLPTEPLFRHADAGPDMLSPGARDRIEARLAANLEKLDGYAGVNNHTGSRFTADARAMRILLAALDERGLYFLDSVTTPDRVAAALADAEGYRVLERDIFLDADAEGGADYVRAQIERVETIAREYGQAIAIAHPYEGTLQALGPWLAKAEERGFELVAVGDLMPPRPAPPLR